MFDFDEFTGGNSVVMCAVSVDARLNVNVILNRPAYQISTNGEAYHARNANDGNYGTDLVKGPCTHTSKETNPCWAVDLGVALYVRGVKFTNIKGSRGMCTECRLNTNRFC